MSLQYSEVKIRPKLLVSLRMDFPSFSTYIFTLHACTPGFRSLKEIAIKQEMHFDRNIMLQATVGTIPTVFKANTFYPFSGVFMQQIPVVNF